MWTKRTSQCRRRKSTSVKWFDYAECKQDVINGTIPNCIDVAELEMLEPHFCRMKFL